MDGGGPEASTAPTFFRRSGGASEVVDIDPSSAPTYASATSRDPDRESPVSSEGRSSDGTSTKDTEHLSYGLPWTMSAATLAALVVLAGIIFVILGYGGS